MPGAADAQYEALSCYGEHVGLAFQIVDDILDVEESSEALGKTAGKDAAQHKITFPAVYGLEHSRDMAARECERAHAVLAPFGERAAAPARTGRPHRPPQIMKTRLDRLIVDRGLAESREKAQALIMAGEVRVNGQKAAKPGQPVESDCAIEMLSRPPYVSRGGYKLAGALRHFALDVTGKVCADIGSSTGGFTDVLLQGGAARVHAVDVGAGQLDWKLRTDPRVVLHEGINAREVSARGDRRARRLPHLRRQLHFRDPDSPRGRLSVTARRANGYTDQTAV